MSTDSTQRLYKLAHEILRVTFAKETFAVKVEDEYVGSRYEYHTVDQFKKIIPNSSLKNLQDAIDILVDNGHATFETPHYGDSVVYEKDKVTKTKCYITRSGYFAYTSSYYLQEIQRNKVEKLINKTSILNNLATPTIAAVAALFALIQLIKGCGEDQSAQRTLLQQQVRWLDSLQRNSKRADSNLHLIKLALDSLRETSK